MSEEIDLLLSEMTNTTKHHSGSRTYYQGSINNKKIIIAFSRWGKVAAAITATDMIKSFGVSEVIFVGVAGAIHNKLNIGDIVIGDSMIQHDMNASPIFEEFEIPLTGIKNYPTDKNSTNKLTEASNQFINHFDVSKQTLNLFGINKPKIHIGTIASGDQFISNEDKRIELQQKIPNLLCVEMEGAAVAQVCFDYNLPCSIIRIISDNANHSAAIDFQSFVTQIASFYSLAILKNYLSNE